MTPRVAVLDHGMGNLHSVAKALDAAGADVTVTSDPAEAGRCAGLCVPGQGIFGRCMDSLAGPGTELIRDWLEAERPFLGICLGMQVLFSWSEESGGRDGLGVIDGRVTRLAGQVKVPHIGWNTVEGGDREPDHFYFDHSYAAHPADDAVVSGWCEHGERFAAEVRRGPILGVQFHPEKSGRSGIDLLKGWVFTL